MKSVVTLLLASIMIPAAHAATRRVEFGNQWETTSSGKLILRSTTDLGTSEQWLGVTVYPELYDRVPEKGVHQLIPLKMGRTVSEIAIDSNLARGTYEAAIWGKRIPRERCASTDQVCQAQGYRLEGMAAYAWGRIP